MLCFLANFVLRFTLLPCCRPNHDAFLIFKYSTFTLHFTTILWKLLLSTFFVTFSLAGTPLHSDFTQKFKLGSLGSNYSFLTEILMYDLKYTQHDFWVICGHFGYYTQMILGHLWSFWIINPTWFWVFYGHFG